MKKNNRLYQYIIILLALSNTPLVLAFDDVDDKKMQAVMPPAPPGPYRSYISDSNIEQNKKQLKIAKIAPPQKQPLTQIAKRAVQPMPPVNWNKNVAPQPQWMQRQSQQQMHYPIAPPAWANKAPPQKMMPPRWNNNVIPQAQWRQRSAPQQMRPAIAPPAWVNNGHPKNMMPQRFAPSRITPQRITPQQITPQQITPQQITPPRFPAPNWNRNARPQPQWVQRPLQQRMRPPVLPPRLAPSLTPLLTPQWRNKMPQQARVPDWVKHPPAWINRAQRPSMPAPQWRQPHVPEWVKNPRYGPKPPEWVTNPPKQPVFRYGQPS